MVDYIFKYDNLVDSDSKNDIGVVDVLARLNELKSVLSELSSSGIDVSKEEDELKELMDSSDIVEINDYMDKLISLKNRLNKYKNYYDVNNSYSNLEKLLNADEIDVDKITDNIMTLSTIIKLPICDSIKETEMVVDKVYRLMYRALKVIVLLSHDYGKKINAILDGDDTFVTYISNLVKEEVGSFNSDNYLDSILTRIKSNGFDVKNYYDNDLISNLAASSNPDLIEKRIELFSKNYDEYKDIVSVIEELNKKIDDITSRNNCVLDSKRKIIRQNIKKYSFYSIMGLLVGFSIGLNVKFFKKHGHIPTYKTTMETYDSTTGETTISDDGYSSLISDNKKIIITKYTPWVESDTRYNFARTKSVCYVKNYTDYEKSLEEYLSLDSMYLSDVEVYYDYVDEYLEDSYYDTDKYIIKRYTQDLTDIKEKISAFYIFLMALMDLIICAVLGSIIYGEYDTIKFYNDNYKKYKKNLTYYKKELLAKKEEYDKLLSQYSKILFKLRMEYDKLPNFLKEREEIKTKKLEIDNSIKVEVIPQKD